MGMRYGEVTEIMGANGERAKLLDGREYIWRNSDESYVIVGLKDGRVVGKGYSHLE